jgi:hypothetical protein
MVTKQVRGLTTLHDETFAPTNQSGQFARTTLIPRLLARAAVGENLFEHALTK